MIPCLNGAAHVRRAVRAAWGQSLAPVEVLVVDDGSTDDSVAEAEGAGARVLRTAGRQGPGAARNVGVRAAIGELVAFVDADDWWEPGHVREVVNAMERAGAAVGVSRWRRHDDPPTDSPLVLPRARGRPLVLQLARETFVLQSAAVARREAVLQVGGYEESLRYGEDYDLWLRLAENHDFAASGEVTCHYAVHPGQVTQARDKVLRGCWEARMRLRERSAAASADDRASLDRTLLDAWDADMRWAWWTGNRVNVEAVLALRPFVEGADTLERRWRQRQLLWTPIQLLRRMRRRWRVAT